VPAWTWTTTWRRWSASPARCPGRLPLEQARAAGKFTPVHEAWWAAARKARGDAAGTRALVEVLLLHRHMDGEHVVAGLAAALQAGALTADAVALEARKAADESDSGPSAPQASPAPPPAVASLTASTFGGNIIETGTDSYRLARTRAAQQN
jgi:hypothetical protein